MATNPDPPVPAAAVPAMYRGVLTAEDLLSIARDTLRGRASDHYRLSLLSANASGGPERLKELEDEMTDIRGKVQALEAQAAGD